MLSSSSDRKYRPFIFAHLLHMHSGKTVILFSFIIAQFMMGANSRIHFGFKSYSFVCTLHHLIIIIVETYLKTLNLKNVRHILSVFFQLTIIQFIWLCVFRLPISLVMIERIYILSYYHHQIGSMNYHPLFRFRSWNNDMRCMSRYIRLHGIIAHDVKSLSWAKIWELYNRIVTSFTEPDYLTSRETDCFMSAACYGLFYLAPLHPEPEWYFRVWCLMGKDAPWSGPSCNYVDVT